MGYGEANASERNFMKVGVIGSGDVGKALAAARAGNYEFAALVEAWW